MKEDKTDGECSTHGRDEKCRMERVNTLHWESRSK
jgi:hypothetical protein